jgi:hypothetical protein
MAIPVDRVGDKREHLLLGRQVACFGCRWIVCVSHRRYETGDDERARVDLPLFYGRGPEGCEVSSLRVALVFGTNENVENMQSTLIVVYGEKVFSAAQHHFVFRRPGIAKAYSLLLLVPM